MVSWLSTDSGVNWSSEGGIGVPGADPSLVHNSDGSFTMFYKTFSGGDR